MLKIIEYIKDFFSFILELFKFVGNLLLSLVNILIKCVGFLGDVMSLDIFPLTESNSV